MPKATDQLLKDHKMIRKVLEGFSPDHARFPQLLKTLQRIVIAHAWFEDKIFLPAFQAEPLLHRRFVDEIYQEHRDIEFLLNICADGTTHRFGVFRHAGCQPQSLHRWEDYSLTFTPRQKAT